MTQEKADSLENVLINFTTLQFSSYDLRRLQMLDMAAELKMTSKHKSELMQSWKHFGTEAGQRIVNLLKLYDTMMKESEERVDPMLVKENARTMMLSEKLNLFMENVDDTWLLDNKAGSSLIFRPLWMTQKLAEEYLWRHAKKFVLMSASFPPKEILAKCLGIDMDDIDYFNVPSQFPIENRPVYCKGVANMTSKTTDVELPKLADAIQKIINRYPNVKGIVHCVSYKLANQLAELIGDPRLLIHNSKNRQDVVEEFMESKKPLVLLSPSLERGISLEEDLCRFIIIAKAPYLNLGDKITKARLYSGKMHITFFPRSIRSKTNISEPGQNPQPEQNSLQENENHSTSPSRKKKPK